MTFDDLNKDAKVTWLHTRKDEVNNSPANANKEHVYQDVIDDLYMRVDELRVMADNMIEYFQVGDVTITELQDIRKLNWAVNALADSLNTSAEDMDNKYGRKAIGYYSKFHKVTFK